jgi:hypothetical protein
MHPAAYECTVFADSLLVLAFWRGAHVGFALGVDRGCQIRHERPRKTLYGFGPAGLNR